MAALHRIALAAKRDGLHTGTGCFKVAGNAERDFHRKVASKGWLQLPMLEVKVPVRGKERNTVEEVWWPMFPPHIVFAEIAKNGLANDVLGASAAAAWWEKAELQGARVLGHPALPGKDDNSRGTCVPIRLHGAQGQTYQSSARLALGVATDCVVWL